MSTKNYYNFGTINNDNSRHVTINAPGADIASLVRSIFAEDVTFPSSSGAPDDSSENNSSSVSSESDSGSSSGAPDVSSENNSSSNSPGSNPDNSILPIPKEGKYSQVREYIKERSRFDAEFKTFVQDRSLRDLCTRLTDEFGWFVDEHSLGSNLNRHRKD